MGGSGSITLATGSPIDGGPLSFESIYQAVMKAISDPNYARQDEIKEMINMVYFELLACDDLYPLYWLVECDEARKTVDRGTITGITQAEPGVVTEAGHGKATGDLVMIDGVVGMTELNKRTFRILKVDANSYQLLTLNGANVSTAAYTAYSSGGYAYYRGSAIDNCSRILKAGLYGYNDPLDPITPQEVEADSGLTNTSLRRPTRFHHRQAFNVTTGAQYDYIELYGAADDTYYLRVWYEKQPARMYNTTDIPYMPHRFMPAIIAGAITRLGENKVQVEAGVVWPGVYQIHVEAIKSANRRWWHEHENSVTAQRKGFLK